MHGFRPGGASCKPQQSFSRSQHSAGCIRLTGTPRPPTWLALGHGAIAASGLVTLGYYAATQTLPTFALAALALFVLAALGGITVFALFHLREKPLPIPLILGHGAIAATAFVLLLLAVFQ